MDICKNCNSKEVYFYSITKCNKCGDMQGGNFGISNKKTKLKVIYNEEQDKVHIIGNKEGLEFLANCCLRIIGKKSPSGHIHLEWQMNNLLIDSTETILEFSDTPEKF